MPILPMRFAKMPNAKQLIKTEEARLLPYSDEAKLELSIIFEEITGKDCTVALIGDAEISDEAAQRLKAAVDRLIKGEPIQYILGKWCFMGNDFIVSPDVLIPRSDTEVLTELAMDCMKGMGSVRVLDLCCGSGCIGISIARACKNANVTCADISEKALEITKRNIELNDVSDRAVALHSDMFSECGIYDVIVSNPPYIPTDVVPKLDSKVKDNEPGMALDGGMDGLDFYRIIAEEAKKHLSEKGRLFVEIGYDQAQSVTALLEANGYKEVECTKDYSGNDRVISAKV